jgi:hypothetical protein
MDLNQRIKLAAERSSEAYRAYERVMNDNEGMTAREHVRKCNAEWKKMRDVFDHQRAIENQAEKIAAMYAERQGLPAPQTRRDCMALWEALGEAWTEYDIELQPIGKIPEVSRFRLNEFEVAAKELSAAEAAGRLKAAEMAIEQNDTDYGEKRIDRDEFYRRQGEIIEIQKQAHEVYENLTYELARDYVQKQADDWERPIGDIIDEWMEEHAED